LEHRTDPENAKRRYEFQRSKGIRVERTADGLFYPDDGFVDPTDLLKALRCACRADLRENDPVEEIDSSDHGAVVVAAGAWSDRVRVTYRGQEVRLPPVKPVRGHLIGFDLPRGSVPVMLRRGHDYVLQRSNGFTIAGSTEEDAGFDRAINDAIC